MRTMKKDRILHSGIKGNNWMFALGCGLAAVLAGGLMIMSLPSRCPPLRHPSPVLPPVSWEMPRFQGGVDVNGADVSTLMTLPGIGQQAAEAVVAERDLHGPFFFPEDLLIVKGLGKGKLRPIRDLLTLSNPVLLPNDQMHP